MNNEYSKKFAISNTSLGEWKTLPPLHWKQTWIDKTRARPKKKSTLLGSLTDCLAYTPTALDKRFIKFDSEMPSDKARIILEAIYEFITGLNINAEELNKQPGTKVKIPLKPIDLSDKSLIMSMCETYEHYAKTPERGYNDILKKDGGYLEFLTKAKGKQIISADELVDAQELKKILWSDPTSRPFFEPKSHCSVLFQVPLFAEFNLHGVFENVEFLPLKGLVDDLHFNHNRKEVREVDLKVTENAFTFTGHNGPMKKFDYPQQHSFYDFLIREFLKKYEKGKYKDYAVMNPLNIVIDNDLRTPLLYEYSQEDLQIKREGIVGTPITGWEDTLKEIAFHLNCNDWSRPMMHLKMGKIPIKIFNKK